MKRLQLLILTVAVGLFACRDDTTAPPGEPAPDGAAAEARAAEGWFHVVWGDPPRDGGAPIRGYRLVDPRGRAVELILDDDLLTQHGGPRGLDRKKVRVQGRAATGGRFRVQSIEVSSATEPAQAPVLSGSQPYVTVGCKFSDDTWEPQTIATYRQWTTGTAYPGLYHYWRQLSYGMMDVGGSTVVGWYTLPYPTSHYISNGSADLSSMATDCTAVADADVYFPQYVGINLQFNAWMDYSWGGSWTLDLDGQTRSYGMTWMASWAGFSVYAHEEGHTFGLPHSSGPYDATYDSYWDVMSSPYPYYDYAEGTYIPTHTIAFHKYMLGWLSGVLVAQPESRQSIVLGRLANLAPGYLMALIPLHGTDQTVEYTVEARRQVGKYEVHVPGNAVVIHLVDQARWDRMAQVVDPDNNGNPNDDGAMWTAGETFTDAANGITVRVDSMTATGFGVTITRTSSGLWTSRAPLPTPRKAFSLGAVGGVLYALGGIGDGPVLKSVHAYNAANDAWTARAAMPAPRYDGDGAAAIGGLLYVAGGRNTTGVLTNTLYAYNPSTNTWSTRATLPSASGCGGSGAISSRLYVFTGCSGAAGYTGKLHRYTPSTNGWTARASAPVAHGFPAVGVINGLLYVAGGRNAAGTVTARLDVYNPATNAWIRKAAMPGPRFGSAGWALNGKLYVVGGNDGQGIVATTFVYDPATDQWSAIAPMPTARAKLGAASAGGYLFAVGGQFDANPLTVVERYKP